jgi:predicted nucleotidyltransferase
MTDSTTIDNAIEFRDKLNPKLWDDWNLNKDAEKHLKYVADRFVEWLEIPIDVKDIWIVGSMASFNYSDTSDIDLHIYVDLSKFKDKKTIKDLLETKTKLFKKLFPIKLFGIPIELTIEDDSNRAESPGIYSIKSGEWIKKPKKVDEDEVDTDDADKISGMWKKRIKAALQNKSLDSDDLNDLKDAIKDQRRKALRKDGEFSDGNIAFKDLRKTGYIDKIKDVRDAKFKKELTKTE